MEFGEFRTFHEFKGLKEVVEEEFPEKFEELDKEGRERGASERGKG